MALRFQDTCVGVAAVRSETLWKETAFKEHNKVHEQKLINLICIPSVLIWLNCLSSSVGACVAQSRYGIVYGVNDRGIVFGFLAICCTLTHIHQMWSRDDLRIYSTDTRCSFVWGSIYKRPHPLMWATSRVSRGKIAVSVIHNNLNYCVIFIAYKKLTNLD